MTLSFIHIVHHRTDVANGHIILWTQYRADSLPKPLHISCWCSQTASPSLYLSDSHARPLYLYYTLPQNKFVTTTSQAPLESSWTHSISINKDWLYVSGNMQDANSEVQLFDTSPDFSWLPHSQQSSLPLWPVYHPQIIP